MASPNTDQPAPCPSRGPLTASAHWQVMQDLAERAEIGQERYGTPLTSDNGRDHLVDAYQELLDFLPYMRLALNAWEELRLEVAHIRQVAHAAPRPPESAPHPLALEEMATILRGCGWVVCPPEQQSIVAYQAVTIDEVAATTFQERHGRPWTSHEREECVAALARHRWSATLSYADHRVPLSRTPDLAPWFPSGEGA